MPVAPLTPPSRSWRFASTVTVSVYGEVMESGGPPDEVRYDLDESLGLLAALEDARDALADTDHLAICGAARTADRGAQP